MALRRERFSDEEISQLLDLSQPQWKMHGSNYQWSHYRHWWACKEIDDAVIKWANENKIWPIDRDYYHANGLPSPNVRRTHDNPQHWCRKSQNDDGSYRYGYWYDRPQRSQRSLYERIALRASELEVPLVLSIPNLTARRNAVEAFGGAEALLRKGGGEQVQQDDYGILWRLNYNEPGTSDWFLQYVEVVNSTAREDGEFDHYFLRVPPSIKTAKDGVAWTGHYELSRWHGRWDPPLSLSTVDRFGGFAAQS